MRRVGPVVVLGGTGYVGTALRHELESQNISYHSITRQDCDCFESKSLTRILKDISPCFLINAAGFTGQPNVDACETQMRECLRLNAVLPAVIRSVCKDLEISWGHVSSGCIYTGRRKDGSGFTEEDEPNFTFTQDNCSFYSGTKALGEEALRNASCYIWRLRLPISNTPEPRNYLTKVISYDRLLNVCNSLSHLGEFSAACVACFTRKLPYGIYNLTNGGSIETREIVELLREAGVMKKPVSFFASEEEFMLAAAIAPRSSCVLDNRKAISAGLQLSEVRDAIRFAVKCW